jgi:hypothetical protein
LRGFVAVPEIGVVNLFFKFFQPFFLVGKVKGNLVTGLAFPQGFGRYF